MGDYGGVDLNGYFPPDQIDIHDFCDLYEGHYPVIASCLGLDVAIAPLAHTEFNRCKSPLKFAEYTFLGYPSILENIETYSPYVKDGEDALLASDPDQWGFALNQLYNNPGLRAKLHWNAQQLCKSLFDVNTVCYEWLNAFKSVFEEQGVSK